MTLITPAAVHAVLAAATSEDGSRGVRYHPLTIEQIIHRIDPAASPVSPADLRATRAACGADAIHPVAAIAQRSFFRLHPHAFKVVLPGRTGVAFILAAHLDAALLDARQKAVQRS